MMYALGAVFFFLYTGIGASCSVSVLAQRRGYRSGDPWPFGAMVARVVQVLSSLGAVATAASPFPCSLGGFQPDGSQPDGFQA